MFRNFNYIWHFSVGILALRFWLLAWCFIQPLRVIISIFEELLVVLLQKKTVVMYKIIPLSFILLFAHFCTSADVIDKDVVITNVDRSVDITTQIVKITSKITLSNKGKNPVAFFLFAVEPETKSHVSFLSCSTTDGKSPLQVVATKVSTYSEH